MNLFISKKPTRLGGGSNTFAAMFCHEAKRTGHRIVEDIANADRAIVVAHLAEETDIERAKSSGCHIVHRLDEYFEKNEDDVRKTKHDKIIRLNRFADITVFQSRFVLNNVQPYLNARRYCIIHNGGDSSVFRPAGKVGKYIGHVSWGVDTKKRLDILLNFIHEHPEEKFLLIGRHAESGLDFNLPNVMMKGAVGRRRVAFALRRMKLLFFPSEKDPCPNTVIESILSGIPVCYNEDGGTVELVKDCGEPLRKIETMISNIAFYRQRCLERTDLSFKNVFKQYITA